MKKLICQGSCEEHQGVVRTVFVSQWGEFDYCDAAIAEDIARGFIVSEIYSPSYYDADAARPEIDSDILRALGHHLR